MVKSKFSFNNIFSYIKKNYFNIAVIILLLILIGSNFNNNINYIRGVSKSVGVEDNIRNFDYSLKSGVYSNTEDSQIKSASISIESYDYDISKSNLLNSIKNFNGKIERENEYKYQEGIRTLNLNVKIPKEELENFIADIKAKEGENIVSININSYDVSEQKQDYSERLERYRNQIKKYKEMLKRENLKVEDEIKIQNRIDQLENQIYYLEKNEANLDEDINYSTVNIYLREKINPIKEIDVLTPLGYFALFLNSLNEGFKFIIKMMGYLIEIVLLYLFFRLITKGIRIKNK